MMRMRTRQAPAKIPKNTGVLLYRYTTKQNHVYVMDMDIIRLLKPCTQTGDWCVLFITVQDMWREIGRGPGGCWHERRVLGRGSSTCRWAFHSRKRRFWTRSADSRSLCSTSQTRLSNQSSTRYPKLKRKSSLDKTFNFNFQVTSDYGYY